MEVWFPETSSLARPHRRGVRATPDRVWKEGEDGEVGITNRFITTDQSHSDHAAFYPI
jgi:hypothetical protein